MQKRSVSADSLGPARPATRMRPACGIAQTLRRAAEGACGPRVDVGRGRGSDWGARERTRRGSCRRPRRRTSTPGTPRSSPSTWTRRPRLFRCPPVWQEPHPSSWMAPLLLCRTCNCDEIFEVPCLSTLITAPVRNSANAHRSQYVQLTCH